ncbi:hypothetical protein EI94DRAFT_1711915 [Lactarius quietus]|nr:hypothetical protein EI94DRAFT_1711915 [Lactarius quietus]
MGWGGADMARDGLWEKEEKRGCFKVRKESIDDMGMATCVGSLFLMLCVRSQRSMVDRPWPRLLSLIFSNKNK